MSDAKADSWMPMYGADYLAKTTHLNAEQHGAYFLLLLHGWKHRGRLPLGDAQLFQITRMTPKQWRESRTVLLDFFVRDGDGYTQKRQIEEITKARKMVSAKSAAGKLGADARWQKDSRGNGTGMAAALAERMAEGMRPQCHDDAPSPLPTPNLKARSKTTREPPSAFAPPDWVPRREWDDFDEMRRRKNGTAWTARARELAVQKLESLRDAGHDPIDVLRNAVLRSWSGLFAPDADKRAPPGRPNDRRTDTIDQLTMRARHERTVAGPVDCTPLPALPGDLRQPGADDVG